MPKQYFIAFVNFTMLNVGIRKLAQRVLRREGKGGGGGRGVGSRSETVTLFIIIFKIRAYK